MREEQDLGRKISSKDTPLPLFLHERDVGEVLAPKTKSNEGFKDIYPSEFLKISVKKALGIL